ncbi:unnamed protein product [Parnassius mnemosyne]|uniref:Uncharacterized protein n=1 Tax=Parnassius mnemosyne TaxID=213953 RepID=A0AAV1KG63_9NEOP
MRLPSAEAYAMAVPYTNSIPRRISPLSPTDLHFTSNMVEKGLKRLRQRTESGRTQRTRLQRFNALEIIRHPTPSNRTAAPDAADLIAPTAYYGTAS